MDYLIILLIDNFFIYKLNLIFIEEGGDLYYIKIIFLLFNIIFMCQLLD